MQGKIMSESSDRESNRRSFRYRSDQRGSFNHCTTQVVLFASFSALLIFHYLVHMKYLVDSFLVLFFFSHSEYASEEKRIIKKNIKRVVEMLRCSDSEPEISEDAF